MKIPAIIRAGSLRVGHRTVAARATVALSVSMFCCAAHAGPITLTCGEPALSGTMSIDLVDDSSKFRPSGHTAIFLNINIPGTDSASDKCLAIANAINAAGGNFAATATGNVVAISDMDIVDGLSVLITADTTAETDGLSATLAAGDSYRFMEVPTFSSVAPPSGLVFTPFIVMPGQIVTPSFTADGTLTAAQILLDDINPQFCSGGVCFNYTFQISGGGFGLMTSQVTVGADPIVEIDSDANTAEYLATIGLAVYSAPSSPEPGSLCLAALGLAGVLLASWRRKLPRRSL